MMRTGLLVLSLVVLCACDEDKPPPPTTSPSAKSPPSSAAVASGSASAPSSTTKPARAAASAPKKVVPTKKARYQKLTDAEVKDEVTPHLDKGTTIAHPPYRGPYGPSQRTVVVITKNTREDFGGFVLVEHGGKTKKMDLPVLQASWPGVSVEAVGFIPECDGDPVEELVVISTHRSASGVATVATAFDFDGERFRRLADVEMLAAKAKTVSEVRKLLTSRSFIMHVDGVPVRILPTVQPAALRAHLEKLMGVKATSEQGDVLELAYAEKEGVDPAEFVFDFNASKVLEKIIVGATGAKDEAEPRNPTGRRLASWLADNAGKGKAQGTTTTWEHNGWIFVLDAASTAASSHHNIEVRPLR